MNQIFNNRLSRKNGNLSFHPFSNVGLSFYKADVNSSFPQIALFSTPTKAKPSESKSLVSPNPFYSPDTFAEPTSGAFGGKSFAQIEQDKQIVEQANTERTKPLISQAAKEAAQRKHFILQNLAKNSSDKSLQSSILSFTEETEASRIELNLLVFNNNFKSKFPEHNHQILEQIFLNADFGSTTEEIKSNFEQKISKYSDKNSSPEDIASLFALSLMPEKVQSFRDEIANSSKCPSDKSFIYQTLASFGEASIKNLNSALEQTVEGEGQVPLQINLVLENWLEKTPEKVKGFGLITSIKNAENITLEQKIDLLMQLASGEPLDLIKESFDIVSSFIDIKKNVDINRAERTGRQVSYSDTYPDYVSILNESKLNLTSEIKQKLLKEKNPDIASALSSSRPEDAGRLATYQNLIVEDSRFNRGQKTALLNRLYTGDINSFNKIYGTLNRLSNVKEIAKAEKTQKDWITAYQVGSGLAIGLATTITVMGTAGTIAPAIASLGFVGALPTITSATAVATVQGAAVYTTTKLYSDSINYAIAQQYGYEKYFPEPGANIVGDIKQGASIGFGAVLFSSLFGGISNAATTSFAGKPINIAVAGKTLSYTPTPAQLSALSKLPATVASGTISKITELTADTKLSPSEKLNALLSNLPESISSGILNMATKDFSGNRAKIFSEIVHNFGVGTGYLAVKWAAEGGKLTPEEVNEVVTNILFASMAKGGKAGEKSNESQKLNIPKEVRRAIQKEMPHPDKYPGDVTKQKLATEALTEINDAMDNGDPLRAWELVVSYQATLGNPVAEANSVRDLIKGNPTKKAQQPSTNTSKNKGASTPALPESSPIRSKPKNEPSQEQPIIVAAQTVGSSNQTSDSILTKMTPAEQETYKSLTSQQKTLVRKLVEGKASIPFALRAAGGTNTVKVSASASSNPDEITSTAKNVGINSQNNTGRDIKNTGSKSLEVATDVEMMAQNTIIGGNDVPLNDGGKNLVIQPSTISQAGIPTNEANQTVIDSSMVPALGDNRFTLQSNQQTAQWSVSINGGALQQIKGTAEFTVGGVIFHVPRFSGGHATPVLSIVSDGEGHHVVKADPQDLRQTTTAVPVRISNSGSTPNYLNYNDSKLGELSGIKASDIGLKLKDNPDAIFKTADNEFRLVWKPGADAWAGDAHDSAVIVTLTKQGTATTSVKVTNRDGSERTSPGDSAINQQIQKVFGDPNNQQTLSNIPGPGTLEYFPAALADQVENIIENLTSAISSIPSPSGSAANPHVLTIGQPQKIEDNTTHFRLDSDGNTYQVGIENNQIVFKPSTGGSKSIALVATQSNQDLLVGDQYYEIDPGKFIQITPQVDGGKVTADITQIKPFKISETDPNGNPLYLHILPNKAVIFGDKRIDNTGMKPATISDSYLGNLISKGANMEPQTQLIDYLGKIKVSDNKTKLDDVINHALDTALTPDRQDYSIGIHLFTGKFTLGNPPNTITVSLDTNTKTYTVNTGSDTQPTTISTDSNTPTIEPASDGNAYKLHIHGGELVISKEESTPEEVANPAVLGDLLSDELQPAPLVIRTDDITVHSGETNDPIPLSTINFKEITNNQYVTIKGTKYKVDIHTPPTSGGERFVQLTNTTTGQDRQFRIRNGNGNLIPGTQTLTDESFILEPTNDGNAIKIRELSAKDIQEQKEFKLKVPTAAQEGQPSIPLEFRNNASIEDVRRLLNEVSGPLQQQGPWTVTIRTRTRKSYTFDLSTSSQSRDKFLEDNMNNGIESLTFNKTQPLQSSLISPSASQITTTSFTRTPNIQVNLGNEAFQVSFGSTELIYSFHIQDGNQRSTQTIFPYVVNDSTPQHAESRRPQILEFTVGGIHYAAIPPFGRTGKSNTQDKTTIVKLQNNQSQNIFQDFIDGTLEIADAKIMDVLEESLYTDLVNNHQNTPGTIEINNIHHPIYCPQVVSKLLADGYIVKFNKKDNVIRASEVSDYADAPLKFMTGTSGISFEIPDTRNGFQRFMAPAGSYRTQYDNVSPGQSNIIDWNNKKYTVSLSQDGQTVEMKNLIPQTIEGNNFQVQFLKSPQYNLILTGGNQQDGILLQSNKNQSLGIIKKNTNGSWQLIKSASANDRQVDILRQGNKINNDSSKSYPLENGDIVSFDGESPLEVHIERPIFGKETITLTPVSTPPTQQATSIPSQITSPSTNISQQQPNTFNNSANWRLQDPFTTEVTVNGQTQNLTFTPQMHRGKLESYQITINNRNYDVNPENLLVTDLSSQMAQTPAPDNIQQLVQNGVYDKFLGYHNQKQNFRNFGLSFSQDVLNNMARRFVNEGNTLEYNITDSIKPDLGFTVSKNRDNGNLVIRHLIKRPLLRAIEGLANVNFRHPSQAPGNLPAVIIKPGEIKTIWHDRGQRTISFGSDGETVRIDKGNQANNSSPSQPVASNPYQQLSLPPANISQQQPNIFNNLGNIISNPIGSIQSAWNATGGKAIRSLTTWQQNRPQNSQRVNRSTNAPNTPNLGRWTPLLLMAGGVAILLGTLLGINFPMPEKIREFFKRASPELAGLTDAELDEFITKFIEQNFEILLLDENGNELSDKAPQDIPRLDGVKVGVRNNQLDIIVPNNKELTQEDLNVIIQELPNIGINYEITDKSGNTSGDKEGEVALTSNKKIQYKVENDGQLSIGKVEGENK